MSRWRDPGYRSNIGIFALSAASALKRPVHAFEPFAPAAKVLREVAHDYSLPVSVLEVAVSSQLGTVEFYISAKSDMSNSLNPQFRQHAGKVQVPTTTVDFVTALIGKPSVIKIDTESTEMQVLEGAVETLRTHRPSLLLEVVGDGERADPIVQFLTPFGYRICELGTPGFRKHLVDISDLDAAGDKRNWLITAIEDEEGLLAQINRWLLVLKTLPVADA